MSTPVRVLCVDDHAETANSTGQILEQAGCTVRICHDGATALSMARGFDPDVCVLDLRMPDMGGDELVKHLREQAGDRRVRYIVLTGDWDIQAQHESTNAGFERHLVKPVDPDRLIEAVTG